MPQVFLFFFPKVFSETKGSVLYTMEQDASLNFQFPGIYISFQKPQFCTMKHASMTAEKHIRSVFNKIFTDSVSSVSFPPTPSSQPQHSEGALQLGFSEAPRIT